MNPDNSNHKRYLFFVDINSSAPPRCTAVRDRSRENLLWRVSRTAPRTSWLLRTLPDVVSTSKTSPSSSTTTWLRTLKVSACGWGDEGLGISTDERHNVDHGFSLLPRS